MTDNGTTPAGVPGLAAAVDVTAAAEAVVAHLADLGRLLPSVYVERAGRLRCLAQRGYWQVYDGMLPHSGIIGRTHSTGRPTYSYDVQDDALYLEATPDLRTEICLPLQVAGRAVGVLNVESPDVVEPELVAAVEAAAEALQARIGEVGVPGVSASQRLARHAVGLVAAAGRGDREAVLTGVLAAATDVSDFPSALLAVAEGPRIVGATGPFARALTAMGADVVAAALEWTRHGTSSYTQGTVTGFGMVGATGLRDAGVRSFVALPVGRGEDDAPAAVLLCAAADVRKVSTETVELLELLAAHVAGCLSTVDAVATLRRRALTDPLTGLGHGGAFRAALDAALQDRRRPGRTAVLYVDVDGFKDVNDLHGHAGGDRVLVAVAEAVAGALRETDRVYRLGGDEFVALLDVVGEAELAEVGERLRKAVRDCCPVSVSVGGAVALPDERGGELVHRADQALYAVKRAGRDGVRLAEVSPS